MYTRLIVEANHARSASAALRKFDALNIELEVLRRLLRVAYELRVLKALSLSFVVANIGEAGRMRGGCARALDGTVLALAYVGSTPKFNER